LLELFGGRSRLIEIAAQHDDICVGLNQALAGFKANSTIGARNDERLSGLIGKALRTPVFYRHGGL